MDNQVLEATTTLPGSFAKWRRKTTAGSWRADARFLLQSSRPGLWPTAVWFYLLPLGQRNVLGSVWFWLGLVFVTFPMGVTVYGWNDYGDSEQDRFHPRKGTYLFGARGSARQVAMLPAAILCALAPFVLLFGVQLGLRAVWWFLAFLLVAGLYNWPSRGLKGRAPFELFIQPGYVLMFPLSSWLNQAPQLPWPTFVFGALFAMHSHLFGEIMDLETDRHIGRRTTATLLGTMATKFALTGFLAAEAALILTFFRSPVIGVFLALSALWFLLDAVVIWKDRPYSLAEMRWFLMGWNLVVMASIPWVWAAANLTRIA